MRQNFLFLQGPPNAYWSRLAENLKDAGHGVQKINLCLADQVFWRGGSAINYRGKFKNWQKYLQDYLVQNQITDIVYYADQQPYHKVARKIARQIAVKCWAIEFGYLRPDWLTLEQDGMGPVSHFPRNRTKIEQLATEYSDPEMKCIYAHKFIKEAAGEVVFHLLQSFGRPLFPFFKADKIYWPIVDYLAWLPELLREKKQIKQAAKILSDCKNTPFWLIALQIQADYQIRSHCPYAHQEEMLAEIFASFAANQVPGDLIIKTHPLDNGLENWHKRVARQAQRFGISERVKLIKGGDLGTLINNSRGVIVSNSTVGLHSLAAEKPTLTLGATLFDIKGLTHQSEVGSFWHQPEKPDIDFFKTYRRALCSIQIKGSFYNRKGQAVAAAEMVNRMTLPAGATKNSLRPEPEALIIAAE